MSKPISIFHISGNRYGGWPTFFTHLIYGMEDAKVNHRVYRIASKTEDKKRSYGNGVMYKNLSLKDAVKVAKNRPTMISAIETKGDMGEWAYALVEAGAVPVIHDPNELRPEIRDLLNAAKTPIFTVRKRNVYNLDDLGHEGIYVPHPYRAYLNSGYTKKKFHAVGISRIDFEKHIEIIAVANKELPEDKRVKIHGFIFRPYAQHTLDKKFKWWRDDYVDRWPYGDMGAAIRIASKSIYVVDMSWIKNDGGGTQYTHLEAWNGGARLILHENWLTGYEDCDEVEDAAAFIDTPEELEEMLLREGKKTDTAWERRMKAARNILKTHEAPRVARTYAKHLRKIHR